MIKKYSFLRKILIAVFALFIALPGFAQSGDIGDYGMWATEYNQKLVNSTISQDLRNFSPEVIDASVPIEAKLGLAFMGGLSKVGMSLDYSFRNFVIIFMLLAYAFWVAFEAYNLIESVGDAKETVKNVVMKGLIISAWIIILNFGIVRAFTIIMIPIISAGSFISNMIWQSVTGAAGYSLDDFQTTCDAIKLYAATNISSTLMTIPDSGVTQSTLDSLKLSTASAAGLLCIPAQMSTFFWSIIKIGWGWVVSNVGASLFGAVIGLYITYLGLKNIWKFLFVSLSVIADLFMGLLLLPFTAIAETTAKTNYKGVAGDLFNTFLEIFKAEKLEVQINRIIKAALYFMCLAVAIGVSISLLTFIIDPVTGQISPDMNIDGLGGSIILILALLLVSYMAEKSQKLAEDWGGKIDAGLGDKLQKGVSTLWDGTKKRYKTLRDMGKK